MPFPWHVGLPRVHSLDPSRLRAISPPGGTSFRDMGEALRGVVEQKAFGTHSFTLACLLLSPSKERGSQGRGKLREPSTAKLVGVETKLNESKALTNWAQQKLQATREQDGAKVAPPNLPAPLVRRWHSQCEKRGRQGRSYGGSRHPHPPRKQRKGGATKGPKRKGKTKGKGGEGTNRPCDGCGQNTAPEERKVNLDLDSPKTRETKGHSQKAGRRRPPKTPI